MNRDALIARLASKGHEDLRLFVYDDATGRPLKKGDTLVGLPSIGIGRNLVGRGITKDEAVILCMNDILDVEKALDAMVAWWRQLDEVRQQVIAEMAFNLGAGGLMNFVNMLAALKAGEYERAADEMVSSAWYRQVGNRAKTLERAMRTGQFLKLEA